MMGGESRRRRRRFVDKLFLENAIDKLSQASPKVHIKITTEGGCSMDSSSAYLAIFHMQ